jgi:hypothetical protein
MQWHSGMRGVSYATRPVSQMTMSCISVRRRPVAQHGDGCYRFVARSGTGDIPGVFDVGYPNPYVHSGWIMGMVDGRPVGMGVNIEAH